MGTGPSQGPPAYPVTSPWPGPPGRPCHIKGAIPPQFFHPHLHQLPSPRPGSALSAIAIATLPSPFQQIMQHASLLPTHSSLTPSLTHSTIHPCSSYSDESPPKAYTAPRFSLCTAHHPHCIFTVHAHSLPAFTYNCSRPILPHFLPSFLIHTVLCTSQPIIITVVVAVVGLRIQIFSFFSLYCAHL